MPGPLSVTVTRKRVAWLAGGGADPLLPATSTLTTTSGRIPASSQASSALSTASFTQVRSDLRGLSNPRRCRFLVKNSDTEISRWRAPISTAVTVLGLALGATAAVGVAMCLHRNRLRSRDQVFGRRAGRAGQERLRAGGRSASVRGAEGTHD